jgi:hypothetical protein
MSFEALSFQSLLSNLLQHGKDVCKWDTLPWGWALRKMTTQIPLLLHNLFLGHLVEGNRLEIMGINNYILT